MESVKKVKLTSSEIAALWVSYQNESVSLCILRYFSEKVEDRDVRSVVQDALKKCKDNFGLLQKIYAEESMTLPIGFTDEDVDPSAPRLYSDTFKLIYLRNMAEAALIHTSTSLARVTRRDIRAYYRHCLQDATEMNDRIVDVMLNKGIYIRAPYISAPEKSEMLTKRSFLTGFLGRRRPLTAVEIAGLYANMERNAYGRTLITGFAQVAKSVDSRKYFLRGKEIATKHVKELSSILIENDLTAPMAGDVNITESTTPPFSDKLMMSMISMLSSFSMSNYATGAAVSMRRDLPALYARLIGEVAAYGEDGMELTIEHGWLEQPPKADDRQALIGV